VVPVPAVELRLAGTADEEFLCAVYASTRAEELAVTGWSDEQKVAFLRSQFDAQHRYYRENYRGAEFWVIRVAERDAGRLYVGRFGEELRIIDLALLPEFRGRGVATSLLGSLIREAAGLGLPLRIHVERFNPALRLYERLGFRLVADRGVYLFLERPPDGKAATAGDETHMGGRA
jgi:GNAT superfamily N-acetyltransferase